MNDKLQARIDAKNRANAIINELLPRLVDACKPFIGRKVTLQTGEFTAKFDKVLDQFRQEPRNIGESILFNARYYGSLDVTVYVPSAEQSVSFGNMERNRHDLKETFIKEPFRTDYSWEEIVHVRCKVYAAREALQSAERELCGFGEYDN